MIDSATAPELKQAFQQHLRETEGHVTRLERIFNQMGMDAKRETCEAMKGIISEGEQIVDAKGDPHDQGRRLDRSSSTGGALRNGGLWNSAYVCSAVEFDRCREFAGTNPSREKGGR